MVKDNRRYYLDLKENSRGRFLRVSQTIARGGPRCQIAIPAQGMIEFRDALQELLDEFGTDDGGFKGELPEGRHMRVENKNFYFDIGQNNRGIYMRISEVSFLLCLPLSVTREVYSFPRHQPIFCFGRRVIYHLKGLWEYIPKSIPSACPSVPRSSN